jgi:hypothetical protein
MASRRYKPRVPAYRRIDIDDPDEVRFWCNELGVPPLDLLRLVSAVGPVVDDVKTELARLGAAGLMASQHAMR